MKYCAFPLLMIGFLTILDSCCTKVGCFGADDITTIDFYDFSQNDLDTITITSYAKSSGFTTVIDSINTQGSPRGDRFSAPIVSRINTDIDYKIKLIRTGQVYILSAFEIKKEGCNSCFPYRPKSDYYNKLVAYQVNGQRQEGSQIMIHR